eukprot:CAMPEP_0203695194 /NCGR_PEP_ID=MMETSP0091-20130426/6713_1 /ASSEMBLY_ACC=CAM_ASM_001089 /TAXON_ID=426623 /ORGANISM="Chaetoceros affinis, Strain CCMP159" /LENGTH=33 /DNA_ID= /DNA_START= /DNA_END= /DNA_ORIENTATION=
MEMGSVLGLFELGPKQHFGAHQSMNMLIMPGSV